MGSLDPAKILVILVIALVVLGPERLPRVARQLGAFWHEFTRIRDDVTEEIRSAIPHEQLPRIPRPTPGAISGFVSNLTSPNPSAANGAPAATAPGVDATDEHPPVAPAGADGSDVPAATGGRPPHVVVHPRLGEFASSPTTRA